MRLESILQTNSPILIEKKLYLNLLVTQNQVSELFLEVLKRYDLSAEQYNVLRILRGQKNKPATMGLIQERMIAKASNTTRLVDKLIAKELVIRNKCSINKRIMEVLITEKGTELLTQIDPKITEIEQQLANRLTIDEQEKLNYLLEKYRF